MVGGVVVGGVVVGGVVVGGVVVGGEVVGGVVVGGEVVVEATVVVGRLVAARSALLFFPAPVAAPMIPSTTKNATIHDNTWTALGQVRKRCHSPTRAPADRGPASEATESPGGAAPSEAADPSGTDGCCMVGFVSGGYHLPSDANHQPEPCEKSLNPFIPFGTIWRRDLSPKDFTGRSTWRYRTNRSCAFANR